ncbi:hypothetical protein CFH99_12030 [Nocardioides aromaticivorans]|uniref:Uncharacterized protein n=1 Tax=Nocardioides aromaticivorans TaxID=200618 RepID=A0ABX7PK63_9ACTN|nr:hypothetical protein [Nocardioides aromaticivorans]QSR26354.1 hypothetical protein CFH99_12030 [Nocardioides aromaticivorans]
MSPRLQLAAGAVLVSGITVEALAGSSRLSGPVIITFSPTHGVHVDDVAVVLAWLVCMVWVVRQWRRSP